MWFIKQYTQDGASKFLTVNGSWKIKPHHRAREFAESLIQFATQQEGLRYIRQSLGRCRNKIVCVNGVIE